MRLFHRVVCCLLAFAFAVSDVACVDECRIDPDSGDVVSRIFEYHRLNSSTALSEMSTGTIFACHHVCKTRNGCRGLSFGTQRGAAAISNCKLYDQPGIQFELVQGPQSTSIILLPQNCTLEKTVNGRWTDWVNTSTCQGECGKEGLIEQTRTCVEPDPRCHGYECPAGPTTRNSTCKVVNCVHAHTDVQVCENEIIEMDCIGGSVVSVTAASYGNERDGRCSTYIPPAVCLASGVTEWLSGECDGKQSCSMVATHFGNPINDPCPGVSKGFKIEYDCVIV